MNDNQVPENLTKRQTLAGVSKYSGQMKIASLLEDALAAIRAYSRTNDYFVGYSLTEVIEDHLEVIGPEDKDEETDVFIPGSSARRTKIAQVNHIWSLLLGTDEGMSKEKGGAIGAAKSLKPEEIEAADGEPEGTGI